MRADRLLSILLLLQTHGRLTAKELADELEVTERTIYRDVYALSYSGVPIYTERGPGGGISLVNRYHSDLTGLTKKEVQALFLLNISPVLTELGYDQQLKAAMIKLSASLPGVLRSDEAVIRQRFHFDPNSWRLNVSSQPPSHLYQLQESVMESQIIEITHNLFMPWGLDSIISIIKPYGLVAKAEKWYVVGKRRDHIFVLSHDWIQEISRTGETFQYPKDFNLLQFWTDYCEMHESNWPSYLVKVKVSPEIAKRLNFYFKTRTRVVAPLDSSGWIMLETEYENHYQALGHLLQLGCAAKVLEPIALKYTIKDYAEQIVKVYNEV
jgi:predicted DNA-binding transcriptional regulator YafY